MPCELGFGPTFAMRLYCDNWAAVYTATTNESSSLSFLSWASKTYWDWRSLYFLSEQNILRFTVILFVIHEKVKERIIEPGMDGRFVELQITVSLLLSNEINAFLVVYEPWKQYSQAQSTHSCLLNLNQGINHYNLDNFYKIQGAKYFRLRVRWSGYTLWLSGFVFFSSLVEVFQIIKGQEDRK